MAFILVSPKKRSFNTYVVWLIYYILMRDGEAVVFIQDDCLDVWLIAGIYRSECFANWDW